MAFEILVEVQSYLRNEGNMLKHLRQKNNRAAACQTDIHLSLCNVELILIKPWSKILYMNIWGACLIIFLQVAEVSNVANGLLV